MTALTLAAGSCGGSTPATPSPITVTRVTVTGTPPVLGSSTQFTAGAIWSDGHAQDVTGQAIWTSSAPSIARVTAGLVTALAPGDAVIGAAFNGVAGAAPLTIAASEGLTTFMRDYIEALFLGTGPLTPTDGVRGCPRGFGTWLGFPSGASVQLIISTTVPSASADALVTAANNVPAFTGGWLSVSVSTTTAADPIPGQNQVTATSHPNPLSIGCGFAQGCTQFTFTPGTSFISSARAVLVSNQFTGAYVHDAIGHGVMGLCHVDGNLIGGPNLSLMSFGPGVFSNSLPSQLSAYDLVATRAVFASGLGPGATRAAFQQAGLVNPVNTTDRFRAPDTRNIVTSQIESPRIR